MISLLNILNEDLPKRSDKNKPGFKMAFFYHAIEKTLIVMNNNPDLVRQITLSNATKRPVVFKGKDITKYTRALIPYEVREMPWKEFKYLDQNGRPDKSNMTSRRKKMSSYIKTNGATTFTNYLKSKQQSGDSVHRSDPREK